MNGKNASPTGSSVLDDLIGLDWLLVFQRIIGFLYGMCRELFVGATRGTMPFVRCLLGGGIAFYCVKQHWDYLIFQKLGIDWLYPDTLWTSVNYRIVSLFSGCLGWAFYRELRNIGTRNRAKQVFENAGLKTRTGQLPTLISDHPTGEGVRRMRIAHRGLSKQEFEKAQSSMEAAMGVYFNGIEENRVRGTVDITYSGTPIPENVELDAHDLGRLNGDEFFIGTGHSGLKRIRLADCPHLLVAGETGSGKSTFLHQFITGLYLQDPTIEMTLIDLKGGLEFTAFADLPGIAVVTDRDEASRRLSGFPEIISSRMRLLRRLGQKNIEQHNRGDRNAMSRHIVIVDEAAEMFLSASDNASKAILSQIARQGRALGLHLVIATQRPDTRALDPQIKANLTGVLCFKMLNDASSITVLGNGKATDLPPLPGRALWKMGPALTELQVPWLDPARAEELLQEQARYGRIMKPEKTVATNERSDTDRFEPLQ